MSLSAAEQRVLQEIDRGEDRIIADLKALVRVPSIVGHEGPCQELVRRKLTELGMTVTAFEASLDDLKTHHAYVTVPWPYAGRPNTWSGSSGGAAVGSPWPSTGT